MINILNYKNTILKCDFCSLDAYTMFILLESWFRRLELMKSYFIQLEEAIITKNFNEEHLKNLECSIINIKDEIRDVNLFLLNKI